MASLRTTLHGAPQGIPLPPADFFCPAHVLIPSEHHRAKVSVKTAEQVVASLDDARLMAWAKNKGVIINGFSKDQTTSWVFKELLTHSLGQGHWWTPALDTWLYYHPSLLSEAQAHAELYAQSAEIWLPLSPDFKSFPGLAALAAPSSFFTPLSLRWLANHPRALKTFLGRPPDQLLGVSDELWKMWQELFSENHFVALTLPERLLFAWLIEHTVPPQFIWDLVMTLSDEEYWHSSRIPIAALLRTSPHSKATTLDLTQELATATDWRVVVNCFDHPNGSASLGPILHERYQAGALASNILRQPLRALARSRHGAESGDIIGLVFSSYDKVAKRLLWQKMPTQAALELAEALLEDDTSAEDLALLPGLRRLDIALALASSPSLKKWLIHPNQTVRIAAISLIGMTSSDKAPHS